MPPRPVTGVIIAFWLAMTGWLIQREVVPMLLADVSSVYTVDLTDQIQLSAAAFETPWVVLRDGKRVGMGKSKVIAHADDNTYEFRSIFHFDQLSIGPLRVRSMENTYRVTDESRLLEVSARITAEPGLTFDFVGKVTRRKIQPTLRINGEELKMFRLNEIDLSRSEKVVNPLHLLNRLRGLRTKQTWTIPLLDPLRNAMEGAANMTIPELIAIVEDDTLTWENNEVACHKIEYRKRGKEDVVARTWVRKTDGLVLQQDACDDFNLVMRRGLK
ncbi:MAG: hypothetical protein EXS16_19690 [Gemmataceae bacterium]|nr:hypothetical protein [Gemmataceae bacterium]